MNYQEVGKQIIEAVGGIENVVSLGHCMTRLRFNLKDMSKVDEVAARQIKGVKGIAKAGGQFQLIIGGEVVELCEEINQYYQIQNVAYDNVADMKLSDIIMDFLAGSMTPLIGVLIGSAMINAIVAIFSNLGFDTTSGTFTFFTTIAGVASYSIPALVGFTAAEKLKTDRMMGALIGLIMMYPALTTTISGGLTVFGLTIKPYTYTGTVIPIFFAILLLKYVDKFARKICSKIVSVFMVPVIDLLIVTPILFLAVGPVAGFLNNIIVGFVNVIYSKAGFLAVGLVAALCPFLVMAGMHMGLVGLITLPYFASAGYDPIFMTAFLAYNISTAGVAFAYAVNSKDNEQKSLGVSAGVSGICGVTEPSLFGIVLTHKEYLISTILSCFIAGAVSGLVGYKCLVFVSGSIFSIPAATSTVYPGNFMASIAVFLTALVASFAFGIIFGRKAKTNK